MKVNNLCFDCLSRGAEKEAILFLHGFPDFADAWDNVAEPMAQAGFRTIAINQRGYSSGARPNHVEDYLVNHLCADIMGVADALNLQAFHLIAHDWGGLVAWQLAALRPDRIRTLSVLSTPHPDALFDAMETDPDQKQRSKYIDFFRMPGNAAESYFESGNWNAFRRIYQGKVSEQRINANIERFSQPGALTATLNWYRALDVSARIGLVRIPSLFIWGSEDMAVGEVAASTTRNFVTGSYQFERLNGKSHWMLDESPENIIDLCLTHIRANETGVK